jgi:hypothetical protein
MEINDNIEFFFENELNDNNTYLEEEFSYLPLIQEKDLINKKINLSSNLNYNKSNEEEKKISKNKKQKKQIKHQKYECIKKKNRESAKRYRERLKLTFKSMINENKLLKEELKNILLVLQKNICLCCKSLNLDKQCEHLIKKNEKEIIDNKNCIFYTIKE